MARGRGGFTRFLSGPVWISQGLYASLSKIYINPLLHPGDFYSSSHSLSTISTFLLYIHSLQVF